MRNVKSELPDPAQSLKFRRVDKISDKPADGVVRIDTYDVMNRIAVDPLGDSHSYFIRAFT